MSASPAYDIAVYLDSVGIGSISSKSSWSILVSGLVDQPDNMIVLFDEASQDIPHPVVLLDFPIVRIIVRSSRGNYLGGYDKAVAIREKLIGITPKTINDSYYNGIIVIQDITMIGTDENERNLFSMRIKCTRQLNSSYQDNRKYI